MTSALTKVTPQIPHEVLISLLYQPANRDQWIPYVQRKRGEGINQRAVTAFMAERLSEKQQKEITPDAIKDRVNRALKGENISPETAEMFVEAFEFSPEQSRELLRAVLAHKLIQETLAATKESAYQKALEQDPGYTSISTIVETEVDRKGLPRYIDVTETIQVTADQLAEIELNFEAILDSCTVLEGGRLTHSTLLEEPTVVEHTDYYRIYITFERPLTRGETHLIRYRVNTDREGMLKRKDRQMVLTAGPFARTGHNIVLAARFDTPPVGAHKKIWSNTITEATLLAQEDLPSQHYHSIYYPKAKDLVLSLWWDIQRDQEPTRP